MNRKERRKGLKKKEPIVAPPLTEDDKKAQMLVAKERWDVKAAICKEKGNKVCKECGAPSGMPGVTLKRDGESWVCARGCLR